MSASSKRSKRLLKDTALFAISNFGSKIILFFLTPLYTSILTTSDYGIADLLNTTLTFVYPILTLAIADATLRFALDQDESPKEVLCCSLFFTLASSVVVFALYPISGVFGKEMHQYWMYFAVTYLLFNIHNSLSNYIKGIGKTSLFAIQGIVQTLTVILSNIILLLFFKAGLSGYLLSIILGYTVANLLMVIGGGIVRSMIPFHFSLGLTKRMLKYSIPMIPTLLAWSVNSSIDKYMIIGFVGLSANGIYSVAHKIPTMITTVISVFNQAWQITAISDYDDHDSSDYFSKVYNIFSFLNLCACVVVIGTSKLLSSFLFAKDFYSAWQFVPFLVVASMFSANSGFLAAIYRAAKKTTSLFVSVLCGSVLNIILNLILIQTIGTVGAAVATAVSFAVVWIVRVLLVQKIMVVRIPIVTTTVAYALLFFTAITYTFQTPYYLIAYAAVVMVLGILYRKTILHLCTNISKILRKFGQKK